MHELLYFILHWFCSHCHISLRNVAYEFWAFIHVRGWMPNFLSGKKHEREFINGDEVGKSEVWVVKKSFFWCCFWVYSSEKPWILYVCKSISLKKTNRNFWGILKENQTVRPEKGTKKQALFQSERLLIDSDGISCKNQFFRHEMTPTFFRLMFVCVYVAKLYILKRATM